MHVTMTAEGLRIHDGVPTLEQMQAVVDGYIETALRIDSSRPGVVIDIYCNDEGLLLELPLMHVRTIDGQPLAGNLIACGYDYNVDETCALVDADVPLILGAILPI
jgi:hypothetical protein